MFVLFLVISHKGKLEVGKLIEVGSETLFWKIRA